MSSQERMHRALVLAPMTSELRPLVRYLRARRESRDGFAAYTGHIGPTNVVITRIGVGPESARRMAARALTIFPADHVVLCGIAGGLHPEMTVGTIVVPEVVIDESSGRRWNPAPMHGVEKKGAIACADHLVLDQARLSQLQSDGVVAMEMESTGVAMACEEFGVPWTTVRCISDRPDDGLTDDAVMSLLRPDGSTDALAALRLVVRHPGRIPGMASLARDSSRAAAKAARVTLGALGWSP